MEMSKKTVKKICLLIAFGGLILFLVMNYQMLGNTLGMLIGVFTPLIIGAVIAFVLNIPMSFFERTIFKSWKNRGLVRALSMVMTFIAVLLVLFGVVSIIAPQLATTIMDLGRAANEAIPKAKAWAEDLFENNQFVKEQIEAFNIDVAGITSNVVEYIKNGAFGAISGGVSAAMAIASGMTSFVLGMVFAIYILAQKETLGRQSWKLFDAATPDKINGRVKYVMQKCYKTFSGFIAGQCTEAVILGCMFFIVLSIAQMPYALLISVMIAIFAFIPLIGLVIACVIGALLILMVSPIKALIFIVIFIILQQVEGNLIYPRVVGNSVGLPPIWVLAAVMVGSSLLGIFGALFLIPFTSVVYSLVREWANKRLAKEKAQQLPKGEEGQT